MPSVSSKQERFMRAAAHNKEFADKAGIKQSVAKEFEKSDEEKLGKPKTRLQKLYKDAL